MKSSTIHNLPDWQVRSWGNGLSYEIENRKAKRSIFFQGDDAAGFRTEFDALTLNSPALDYADALAVIWDFYSEISQPVGHEL